MTKLLFSVLTLVTFGLSGMQPEHVFNPDAIKHMRRSHSNRSKKYEIVYKNGITDRLEYCVDTGLITRTIVIPEKDQIELRLNVDPLREARASTTDMGLVDRFDALWNRLPTAQRHK